MLPWLSTDTYRTVGVVLTATFGALAPILVWRLPTLRSALVAAAYLAFAFYVLPVSTHERYLYPFLALLLPVVVTERRWLWLYVPASVTLVLNMAVVAPPIRAFSGRWVESPFSLAIAAVNVLMFAAYTVAMLIAVRSSARGRDDAGGEEVRVEPAAALASCVSGDTAQLRIRRDVVDEGFRATKMLLENLECDDDSVEAYSAIIRRPCSLASAVARGLVPQHQEVVVFGAAA